MKKQKPVKHYKRDICQTQITKNIINVETGQPLTLPLKRLNESCDFKRVWKKFCGQTKEEKEVQKKYQQSEKGKIKMRKNARKYYQKHKKEMNAKSREWHKKHPGRARLLWRRSYLKNRKKYLKVKKAYYERTKNNEKTKD